MEHSQELSELSFVVILRQKISSCTGTNRKTLLHFISEKNFYNMKTTTVSNVICILCLASYMMTAHAQTKRKSRFMKENDLICKYTV